VEVFLTVRYALPPKHPNGSHLDCNATNRVEDCDAVLERRLAAVVATNGSKIVTDALGDYTIGAPRPSVTGMLHYVVLRRLLSLTPDISSLSGMPMGSFLKPEYANETERRELIGKVTR
jgi:hypothetical protein